MHAWASCVSWLSPWQQKNHGEYGWLHSGDIGRMDSDGMRWHVGVMYTSLGKCMHLMYRAKCS